MLAYRSIKQHQRFDVFECAVTIFVSQSIEPHSFRTVRDDKHVVAEREDAVAVPYLVAVRSNSVGYIILVGVVDQDKWSVLLTS
jgi:hypothetical protein